MERDNCSTGQKKIRLMRIYEMIKEQAPIPMQQIVADIEAKEGLSKEKSEDYVSNLYYRKKINVTNDLIRMITLREDSNENNKKE